MATKVGVNAQLTERLRELHLPVFLECYAEEVYRVRKASSSHQRYL